MKRIKNASIVIILVAILVFASACANASQSKTSTFEWPESSLAQMLPKPETTNGKILTDTEEEFRIELYQIDEEQADSYIEQCKNAGFNIGIYEHEGYLTAYNEDRYYLRVDHIGSSYQELHIELEAPQTIKKIKWPKSEVAGKLPKPKKLKGYIQTDSANEFRLFIANTSVSNFNNYVDACMEAGFTEEYDKDEYSYEAYNAEGDYVLVKLDTNFDLMEIHGKKEMRQEMEKLFDDNDEDDEEATTTAAKKETDGTSFSSIYKKYAKKIKKKTPKLVEEYNNESAGLDMEAKAELSNKKVQVLAKIAYEGSSEMASLMWAQGGDYETYSEWSGKLTDLYMEYAQQITDAYLANAWS